MVSDDYRDREAWVVALGALTALVAFALTWLIPGSGRASRCGPARGAHGGRGPSVLGGVLVVGLRGAALLAVLVALDDAVEHAFPVGSPLDWFWTKWLFPAVQAIEAFAA